MSGRIVIVGYKPKPGKQKELEALMHEHHTRLYKENLVTDRRSIIAQSADGTIIEVFEWRSKEAIEQAHSNPAVQQMWTEYAGVCEYIPAGQIAEMTQLFSEFTPIN